MKKLYKKLRIFENWLAIKILHKKPYFTSNLTGYAIYKNISRKL